MYLAGVGKADITGEALGAGMMGYGRPDQRTTGIHTRLYSRAFVLATPGHSVVLVVAELGQVFHGVRQAVLERLAAKYGTRYTTRNVMITATHTHAGPGGYSHYKLYNLSTRGFRARTFRAVVDGITESIERAHRDLEPSTVWLSRGELHDASVNRSRAAFDANPAGERACFPGAVDPAVTVLRVERQGRLTGVLAWFATHGTSLTNRNTLISGDNKGYAAYRWERAEPGLVAAFAQTNAGDMSPNLALRPGRGPTDDPLTNARVIGERQFAAASALSGDEEVHGGLDHRLSYLAVSNLRVDPPWTDDGRVHRTCRAALGVSFAAGTEDGPGLPLFREGSKASRMASVLFPAEQRPKAILIPCGRLGWTATVVPIQLIRIGQFVLAATAHEPTIVAGLRLRRTVAGALGVPVDNVLVQGYANDYAGYITTPEEYDEQHYEGGHTMYGRWQLPAYQQEFHRIATDMRTGRPSGSAIAPAHLGEHQTAARPRLRLDRRPRGRRWGSVVTQPAEHYSPGDRVLARFVGAHPVNDLRRGHSYLEVQHRRGTAWRTVADDSDWHTTIEWRPGPIAACTATITWDIPAGTEPGAYRIRYLGDASTTRGMFSFAGTTHPFEVGRS